MSEPVLHVAVVGHTNTGKTSLMRTLMRDRAFGAISNRPATTRRVEGASLIFDGRHLVELFDTPGLEDSIGLFELLERIRVERGLDWVDTIRAFLDSDAASGPFSQEAKALAQVLKSDIALYVVDTRDAVLGKHRDELEILARSGVPVLPVLNFTASPEAQPELWTEQLARLGMHAVARFDTVAVDNASERQLYETVKVLAGRFRETLDLVVAETLRRRRWLMRASAELLADLLIDVAAHVILARRDDPDHAADAIDRLKERVRIREQRFVDDLLALHRFAPEDYAYASLPIEDGTWGTDLFNPEALRQFGVKTGSAAAAGAVAGLAIDALVGGITLGAAALTGAAVGAVLGMTRDKGRELIAQFTGYSELRVDDPTLQLLAMRNMVLIEALFRRGHASQTPVHLEPEALKSRQATDLRRIAALLRDARAHPDWSQIGDGVGHRDLSDPARATLRDRLAGHIVEPVEGWLEAVP